MKADFKKLIDLYNDSEDNEKIVFKELLDDLIFFDVKVKKKTKETIELKYFHEKYSNKLIKTFYNLSVRKYWKLEVDNRILNTFNIFIKDNFWTKKLWNYDTISILPTKKIKDYSKPINDLINSNKLNINEYHSKRKILLWYFSKYKLIIEWEKEKDGENIEEIINNIEKTNKKDPLDKLILEMLSEMKAIYWIEEYNKWVKESEIIDEKIDIIRFDKSQVEDLRSRLNWESKINLSYDIKNKTLYYNWNEIHNFKDKPKNDLKMNMFGLMYSYEKWMNINFKQMYEFYNEDDFYHNNNNDFINSKIKSLIWKINIFIKEKTKNYDIILLTQQKEDNNHFIYRNI